MFSVRVSTNLTGRPTCFANHGRRISSGVPSILGPKPPPTSGTITRQCVDSRLYTFISVPQIEWGDWLLIQYVSESPSQDAAAARPSSGQAATRLLTTR